MMLECKRCHWTGEEHEAGVSHFGGYVGDSFNPDDMGWEEWDNWSCPECGAELE